MKRRVLLVVVIVLFFIGIFVLAKFGATLLAPKGRGALQVTSNLKASIYLDNKRIGSMPLCLCNQNQTLSARKYDLKIIPDDKSLQSFSAKITVNSDVLTAVERTFLPGGLASAYILTLEKTKDKNPQIFISSVPDSALISIDGEEKGVTPLDLKLISSSEHEVEITKQGFAKKTVRVRAVPNFRLILNAILGAGSKDEEISGSPTPSTTPAVTKESEAQVLIKNTPTGFLRVRSSPSLSAAEIGRVSPGESYPFVSENDSWFEITLTTGKNGWVSKTYAQKSTQ